AASRTTRTGWESTDRRAIGLLRSIDTDGVRYIRRAWTEARATKRSDTDDCPRFCPTSLRKLDYGRLNTNAFGNFLVERISGIELTVFYCTPPVYLKNRLLQTLELRYILSIPRFENRGIAKAGCRRSHKNPQPSSPPKKPGPPHRARSHSRNA